MSQAQPIITIQGSRVAIGPLRRDLIPLYHAWISNLETTATLSEAGIAPTLDQEIAWFEEEIRKSNVQTFTIYLVEGWKPIGTVNLHQISQRHRKANMGIVIGEPALRGQGYGTEAVELILDYGFTALGLHSIWLTTYEFNLAGQRAYLKAGFKECGRRRSCRWHLGKYWDEVHMDILEHEFTASRIRNHLPGSEASR